MSRNDQENIDHLDLPDPITTRANYYTSTGDIIEREVYQNIERPPRICAKEVEHIETSVTTLFVLCSSAGQMYDPRSTDRRYGAGLWSFRRVSRSTFDLYIKFLTHKYTSLLSQAQRGL